MQELLRNEACHGVVREASDKDTAAFFLRYNLNRGSRYSHNQGREFSNLGEHIQGKQRSLGNSTKFVSEAADESSTATDDRGYDARLMPDSSIAPLV